MCHPIRYSVLLLLHNLTSRELSLDIGCHINMSSVHRESLKHIYGAQSADTQSHSFQCGVLNKDLTGNRDYENLFGSRVDEKTAKLVENIEKFREQFTEK